MKGNQVLLVGYVGQELKKSSSQDGSPRIALRLATHSKRKNQRTYTTVWHDVVAWDATAHFAERNFVKGSRVLINGSIEYRSYLDHMGHRRYFTQIKAHSLMNLDR